MYRIVLSMALFLSLTVSNVLAQDYYQVISESSNVFFKVGQIGIPLVRGRFSKCAGTILVQRDKLISFAGTVDMTGLNTGIPARDKDLKSKKFFEVDKFPAMILKSNRITQDGDRVTIFNELTIRDITRPVILRGTIKRFNDQKISLNVRTTVNRRDFGLHLNHFLEFLVGNNVGISLQLQAQKI